MMLVTRVYRHLLIIILGILIYSLFSAVIVKAVSVTISNLQAQLLTNHLILMSQSRTPNLEQPTI